MRWASFEDFGSVETFKALIRFGDQRLTAGSVWMEIRSTGWADFALISGNRAVVYDSLGASSFRVICEDGTAYSSEVEGSCNELLARAFPGKTPNAVSTFSADGETATSKLGGAADGFFDVWTCRRH